MGKQHVPNKTMVAFRLYNPSKYKKYWIQPRSAIATLEHLTWHALSANPNQACGRVTDMLQIWVLCRHIIVAL